MKTLTQIAKEKAVNMRPSEGAARNARAALARRRELKEKGVGESRLGLTPVGIARARDIARRAELSPVTWRAINSFVNGRHIETSRKSPNYDKREAAWIAWNAWGGDAIQVQARRVVASLDRREKALRFVTAYRQRRQKAATHDGIMIAFSVPLAAAQALALSVDGALTPDDLHITLMYFGRTDEMDAAQQGALMAAVRLFAANRAPIEGRVHGGGAFAPNEETGQVASWAYFDSPELAAWRQGLVDIVQAVGVPYEPTHGFVPHITLAYTGSEQRPILNPPQIPIQFDEIRVHWGDEVTALPLRGSMTEKAEADAPNYRNAGPASTKMCSTCQFADASSRHCRLYDFTYRQGWVCDSWLPDIDASRARMRVLNEESRQMQQQKATRIGSFLLQLRLRKGWSRARLAEGMPIADDTIAQIERGEIKTPSMPVLRAFARSYDVPLSRLLEMLPEGAEPLPRVARNKAKLRRLLRRLKREIPRSTRADLPGHDFVFPSLRSFPIVQPEDVQAAVRAWGRASRVRAAGFDFEDFKRRLTALAERKGDAFVAALPEAWREKGLRANIGEGSLTAFKGNDGRYRWLAISSNTYEDRDGEWVTYASQVKDVERMNANGNFGTIDWWHVKVKGKPLNVGTCRHSFMFGRFRVEAGDFLDETVGKAFAEAQGPFKISLEFGHPFNEPVNGEFHNIATVRRSVLPAHSPSNVLTSFVSV